MKRTGFAGCSSTDLPAHEFLDLDAFTALKLNVKSDGRKYVVSLRTENWITGGKEVRFSQAPRRDD
jgi:NADH dehydrogenase [ubiquinone] 1 alpha subcomplex assembly factor 1